MGTALCTWLLHWNILRYASKQVLAITPQISSISMDKSKSQECDTKMCFINLMNNGISIWTLERPLSGPLLTEAEVCSDLERKY